MKKQPKKYGLELIMNVYDCSLDILTSPKSLKEYVTRLCVLIDMKKYGKTLLPYFGENAAYTKGYSLVQLIETSSITGHFSELWRTAYINIFSCKKFDARAARKFTKDFFLAGKIKTQLIIR